MKTAKLFQNGQSQAVRLPKEFRFEGNEVYIQRVGSAVVLLPYAEPWEALFESLDQFSDDYAARTAALASGDSDASTPHMSRVIGGNPENTYE
jgi:antitoxin VapB